MARTRTLSLLIVAALLLLAGCTAPMGGAEQPASMEMAAPEPVAGQITVANVRARPAPLEGGNAAAYLTVLNGTDAPVRFTGAAGDVAATIELHETVNEGGVMKMIPQLDGFEIPAGGSVELTPGGKHVMLIGLAAPLAAGDAFSLTLSFDDGTAIDLSVPVVEMEGMPGMNMDEATPTPQP